MDDSPVKGLTSPMSIKNVGENNENDESGTPESEKSRKVVRKHYMSSTISAAKKAASLVPRNKILADRNEGFSFRISPKPLVGSAHSIRSNCSSDNDCDDDQNSFGGDSVLKKKILAERNEGFTFATSPKPLVGSAHSIRSNCSSDNACGDDQNRFDGDSVLEKKPYDPLTNYLSPRPKFLRYNPNKKRRIFLCGEDEIGKMKEWLGFVSTSSSFEFQKVVKEEEFEEGALKKGDEELEITGGDCNGCDVEEMEEAEESEEFEEEEEKCWSLLGLMKFFLVLGCLCLSTAFIYSMDSPDPLLTQEAILDFRGGFVNRSNIHEEEVVSRNEYFISEFEVMDGKGEESRLSLLHVVAQKDMVDNSFVEAGIFEDNGNGNGMSDGISILPEQTIEKSEDVYNDELMRKAEASYTLLWEEPNESEGNGNGMSDGISLLLEQTIEKSEDVYNDELMRKAEASYTLLWEEPNESEGNTDIEVVHSEDETLDCRVNECTWNQEIESTDEAFDQKQSTETVEVYESSQKDLFSEIEPSTDTLPWEEPKESEGNPKFKVVHSEAEALDLRVNECIRNQELIGIEAFDQVQSAETVEDLFSEIEPSNELNAELVMMESEEIKLQPEVLGLAVFFSIVAALGFLYRSLQRNIVKAMSFPTQKKDGKEDSLPMGLQHQTAEPVLAAHQIHDSNTIFSAKKVDPIISPSTTPFSPLKVVTEEFSRQSKAPIVELLGELVIGDEANGSFKSIKRRRVLDSEVKNGSNQLFTETTISHSKSPLVQDQMLQYLPQFEPSNASDSSSQRKKSVSKKKGGKGGEVSIASATPVRRSSRIRSKAISLC